MNRKFLKLGALSAALLCVLSVGSAAFAQSSDGTVTQTVNTTNTVTSVQVVPTSGTTILPDQSVTFNAVVSSNVGAVTGILAPTSTVQFQVNGSSIGSPVSVTSASATNLLPYSQTFAANWTAISGAAATDGNLAGPLDAGSATTASKIVFPATAGSGVSYTVSTGSYAGQQLTFSAWVEGSAQGTLSVIISDSTGANAQTVTIPVLTTFHRVQKTITLAAGAGPGFKVSIINPNATAQTVYIQGAQVEQAATAGPYVPTSGASATGLGAIATYTDATGLPVGNHTADTVDAVYAGDTNYAGSTAAAWSPDVTQGTATLAWTSPSSTTPWSAVFGTAETFGVSITGDGSTQFATGGTLSITIDGNAYKTCTPTNGSTAAWSCTGASDSALAIGAHTVTATYSGDPNYTTASISTTITIGQAAATASITTSGTPSTYGQNVTFTITVAGVNGVVPTGTVTVYDNGTGSTGGTAIQTNLTLSGGTVSFSSATLTGGTHDLKVVYSGDGNYAAGTAN